MPTTDVIGLGYAIICDIEKLVAQCNSNSSCYEFNTNSFLKTCASGCDGNCCSDIVQNMDLYILKEPHFCFLSEIANGYIGIVAMSTSLFQSGLFNGKCRNIGKARILLPIRHSIVSDELITSGLHLEKVISTRRYQLNNSMIEHRVYMSQSV